MSPSVLPPSQSSKLTDALRRIDRLESSARVPQTTRLEGSSVDTSGLSAVGTRTVAAAEPGPVTVGFSAIDGITVASDLLADELVVISYCFTIASATTTTTLGILTGISRNGLDYVNGPTREIPVTASTTNQLISGTTVVEVPNRDRWTAYLSGAAPTGHVTIVDVALTTLPARKSPQ